MSDICSNKQPSTIFFDGYLFTIYLHYVC